MAVNLDENVLADESTSILEIDDVAFSYPTGKQVLKGVSLTVRPGSCLCLMGVNGCGKSTLIDCVLGENRLLSGKIRVSGKDVATLKASERARLVSYVPQAHENTFPYLVEQLVTMGRTVYAQGLSGPGTARDKELVSRVLDECGIAHLAKRPCTALSGGEMQMVLLARALVQDSSLIVMDEPTAHLDFRNELLFLETIERLVLQKGVTVLMATHSPNQAFHLERAGVDTRVALLHGGRVFREGAPCDVLDRQSLEQVFGVEGFVAALALSRSNDCVHQVVPLKTIPRFPEHSDEGRRNG